MTDAAEPTREAEGAKKPGRRLSPKKGTFGRALLAIGAVALGLPVLLFLTLLLVSAVSRADPARQLPEGFELYARVPSASEFTRRTLGLKALDAALSGNPDLRSLVRSLRSAPFLRSESYRRLADLRLDAALYPDGSFAAAADMGWRSAATRLAPLAARFLPGLLASVQGLAWRGEDDFGHFEYEAGEGFFLYAATRGNLVLVASSKTRLAAALEGREPDPELERALDRKGGGLIRLLADTGSLTRIIDEGPVASFVSLLEFPELTVVDLDLEADRLRLSIELPASSKDPGLASLLGKRSGTPAILARLPESVEYLSLLALAKPGELWTALAGLLGENAVAEKENADKAARLLFGMKIDELAFSWMGGELGAFGSSRESSPVFFVRIADERARREAFEALLGSALVGQDLSALVEGSRIPRITFPSFLSSILAGFGVRLAEPFYLLEDGFLYLSESAELLASCAKEVRAGALLVKTPRWRSIAEGVSARSSLMVFYDLDRSIPFFLRGSGGLVDAIKLFGGGAASLVVAADALRLELSATNEGRTARGASGEQPRELPGYPVNAVAVMDSDPRLGYGPGGSPVAYWTSGPRVIGMELPAGNRYELSMDEAGYVLPIADAEGRLLGLWALSSRGTIYLCDASLEARDGFPILSGETVTAPPSVSGENLVVPVGGSEPGLLILSPSGATRRSAPLGARVTEGLAASDAEIAVLPRSFDSLLYLLSPSGEILPEWPASLGGIASALPLIADTPEGRRIAALDESGELSLRDPAGIPSPFFPLRLEGVYDADPAWAPGLARFVAVNQEGVIRLIGTDGTIWAEGGVKGVAGRGLVLRLFDLDRDGREEIFLGGRGNALAAFDGDLVLLPGFPVAGSGAASFIDLDGDGVPELVARGTDDRIHAYSLPGSAK